MSEKSPVVSYQSPEMSSPLATECWRLTTGITLLELAILLAIVCVIIFIAIPTLYPNKEEAKIAFAKHELRKVFRAEQAYFNAHGSFTTPKTIATDPQLGKLLPQAFATDPATIHGITFVSSPMPGFTFEVVAVLPKDGGRYRIDQTGKLTAVQ